MNSNNLRTLGVILVIAAGLIYAIERVGHLIADSIVSAGFMAGRITGATPQVSSASFWDNGFVPLLAIGGILMIAYSFAKK